MKTEFGRIHESRITRDRRETPYLDRIAVYEPPVAGDQPAGSLGASSMSSGPPARASAIRRRRTQGGLLQSETGYLIRVDHRTVHAG
ncbi:hypothetical protein BRC62_07815 [Halobacteriales archaeon QH_10_67_13]|nr:MAG: hypothetical protein BRC62_07815 [Halobacteriales archaeon QH_10_67_13]